MRKELIIAIIVGVGLGLTVAFGVYRANSYLNTDPSSPNLGSQPATQETILSPQSANLTLSKPNQNEVITTSPVQVSGITKASSWLVISGEEEDYLVQADNQGTFTVDVDLSSGINQIVISAFDEEGTKNSHNLTLVYSTEFEN
jgi:hypothetical protein